VQEQRAKMLAFKLAGKSKFVPIEQGLEVQNHAAVATDKTQVKLRSYVPDGDQSGLPVMI
jgi:hypothetical protein